MLDNIQKHLTNTNRINYRNEGILICPVIDSHTGVELALSLLSQIVGKKTVLYLSGGRTPKSLYEKITKEEQLIPGAVGIVDERYGEKFHKNSNEKMIRETGLLRYLEIRDVPFYPILQPELSHEETAAAYDQQLRKLNNTFPQSVAIMGIGADGHTSGIAPNRKDFTNPMFESSRNHLFVSEFDDPDSFYGERVGMTFLGLSMQDVLLVLVFGEDKKDALQRMFTDGSEEDIPSRFYKRADIAPKTLIITDQTI